MNTTPPAAGHALRYEILHRNEVRLQSSRQELINDRDNGSNYDEEIRHLKVETMFHRAAVQCLIHSAKAVAERDGNTESVAALDALSSIRSSQLEEDLYLPIGTFWSQRNNHAQQTAATPMEDTFEAPDDLADKFFEMYPEVARLDDDLVYSSSDESVEEVPKKKREKANQDEVIVVSGGDSPTESQPNNRHVQNNYVLNNRTNQAAGNNSRLSNCRDVNNCNQNQGRHLTQSHSNHQQQQQANNYKNPYNQSQQHQWQQVPVPQQPQQQQNQWQNRPPTGSFDYNETNENPPVKMNSFQTANEVKGKLDNNQDDWESGDRNNNRNRRNNNRKGWGNSNNMQEDEPNRGPNNMNSRANNSSRPQQMVQNALNGPKNNMSQGLQKKFQNPKLGANNNNGGGQAAKPSNTNVGSAKDEELPEELKGLNKDLIERIENDIVDNGAKISFDDIAGLDHAKRTVEESIIMPMKNPDLFSGLRSVPKGMLLFGPPGTGKTLIAKAISHESGATFFSISSSSLTSKWIGEGEALVRTLFAVARYRAPSVIFIDEVDSLLTARKSDENESSRKMKTEFLIAIDGAKEDENAGHVLFIGATNKPHEIDEAARRRFVKRLYVALPVEKDRAVLVRRLLTKNENTVTDKEIEKIAKKTEGYSGADLFNLLQDAAMGPVRQAQAKAAREGRDHSLISSKEVGPITYKHLRQALKSTSRTVSDEDLQVYVEWDKTYGSKDIDVGSYDDDTESDHESDDEEFS